MRLERRATENYIESRSMDFLLDSALNRVVAQLQGSKNFRSYSVYRDTPWLFRLRDEDTLGHGRADIKDPRVSSWAMFARRSGTEQWFSTKVLDCTSQINLNGRQDTLARMLENLGEAIKRSERLKRDGNPTFNPLYTGPRESGNRVTGAQIIQLRRRLPGGRFTSKTQLKQLIGPENYRLIRDFVTCFGWEDPYTQRPDDGNFEVPELVGGGGALGGAGTAGQRQPAASDKPRVSTEPRYPINVNTAPREVLIATIWGLAGRRVFPFSFIGGSAGGAAATMSSIDANATILGQRHALGEEEVGSVLPRAIFVYSPRFEYATAEKLADRIISERKIRPFIAWRTNDAGKPGFEDFIDGLEQSFFPPWQNALVIDPDQPANRQIRRLVMFGSQTSPVTRRWVRGTAIGSVRSIYRSLGRAFHDSYAWYYEMIKAVVKANFNPNTRINRYNPNQPAFIESDKSDLVWAQDQFNLLKGYTTEYCFDTNGYYEISTVGQIGPIEERVGGGGTTVVSGSSRARRGRTGLDMLPPFERPFERQLRTVVQVFNVLRHTNQFHFEKTFQSAPGSKSSENNRNYVVTWPDPMEALTELVSGGSVRDGRVELAGLLDGRRLDGQYQQRQQLYNNPVLTFAQGFDARSAQSLSRIRRIRQGRGNALGDEFSDAVKDALDAPYSRLGRTKFYRRKQLVEMSVFTNPSASYLDPFVNREQIGTDIFPDGFHSSILRSTHIGSRVLAYPARQRLDQGREESAAVRVGASGLGSRGQNLLGNVPYYRGGIGFWVKFDFDGDDPVFSGLVGCTQVIKEVSPNASDYTGSEGSQFFVFKNSRGELRIVRMYYHQAYIHSTGGGGGGGESGEPLYPVVEASAGGTADDRNPILDYLDPEKLVSRTDLLVNISHFRAHEWHHIGIDWDDRNPRQGLRLFLDFTEIKQGGGPIFPQAPSLVGSASTWVRLNERQPKDSLTIGGIIREQGESNFGIFKWFTNTTSAGGGTGGITAVAREVKRLMANATIDEFVAFDGKFPSVRTYYGNTAPGYFTNQQGEYANLFEIPLPPHVDSVVLRSLDWTSYYPTTYTDSTPNSIPARVRQTDPIQCEAHFIAPGRGTLPGAFSEPWRVQEPVNRIAGRKAGRRQSGLKGNNAQLAYVFRMRAGQGSTGNTSGGNVATPVIDDVTLTYFLPNPRILLQEEIE